MHVQLINLTIKKKQCRIMINAETKAAATLTKRLLRNTPSKEPSEESINLCKSDGQAHLP